MNGFRQNYKNGLRLARLIVLLVAPFVVVENTQGSARPEQGQAGEALHSGGLLRYYEFERKFNLAMKAANVSRERILREAKESTVAGSNSMPSSLLQAHSYFLRSQLVWAQYATEMGQIQAADQAFAFLAEYFGVVMSRSVPVRGRFSSTDSPASFQTWLVAIPKAESSGEMDYTESELNEGYFFRIATAFSHYVRSTRIKRWQQEATRFDSFALENYWKKWMGRGCVIPRASHTEGWLHSAMVHMDSHHAAAAGHLLRSPEGLRQGSSLRSSVRTFISRFRSQTRIDPSNEALVWNWTWPVGSPQRPKYPNRLPDRRACVRYPVQFVTHPVTQERVELEGRVQDTSHGGQLVSLVYELADAGIEILSPEKLNALRETFQKNVLGPGNTIRNLIDGSTVADDSVPGTTLSRIYISEWVKLARPLLIQTGAVGWSSGALRERKVLDGSCDLQLRLTEIFESQPQLSHRYLYLAELALNDARLVCADALVDSGASSAFKPLGSNASDPDLKSDSAK